MLEEALVDSDPEGPLCELLFFFLSAIFQAMSEEEEEAAKDQITEAETKSWFSFYFLIGSFTRNFGIMQLIVQLLSYL